MASLFGGPKPPRPVPAPNPADAANRANAALARRLAGGGSNSTDTSSDTAAVGGARLPTLTGLN